MNNSDGRRPLRNLEEPFASREVVVLAVTSSPIASSPHGCVVETSRVSALSHENVVGSHDLDWVPAGTRTVELYVSRAIGGDLPIGLFACLRMNNQYFAIGVIRKG